MAPTADALALPDDDALPRARFPFDGLAAFAAVPFAIAALLLVDRPQNPDCHAWVGAPSAAFVHSLDTARPLWATSMLLLAAAGLLGLACRESGEGKAFAFGAGLVAAIVVGVAGLLVAIPPCIAA
jgi:hypothetical protein